MPPTVRIWSGREIRVLREAKRMSIRDFAAHLGVSERMVSKWEAGAEKIHPRPVNQSALDSSLAASPADHQARFADLLSTPAIAGPIEESIRDGAPSDISEQGRQVRHPVDGKLMALVEAGVFLSGPDNESVYLPDFYIDVFPTTNADYARFVAATDHKPPQHWGNSAEPPDDICDHPVVFVTWHDASAYSEWTAKSLPSNTQWEKAARGVRGDIYPWGSQATPAKCNVREAGIGATTPVNRYHSGVSPYGAYDMCGNVWEWLGTSSTSNRHELKGSAFTSPFARCAPSIFNDASAEMLDDDTGFRCATPAETMRALMIMNT